MNENKIAYMESNKFSMLLDHEKMLYVMVILMNLFMMLLKIIMREELMIHDAPVIFKSLSFMRASWSSSCLAKKALKKTACWETTQHLPLLFLCVHIIKIM